MTQRAKDFVEYWIAEFLHPDTYEDEDDWSESAENAADCLRNAAKYGIMASEIEEEFGDLVALIAATREQIMDAHMRQRA